MTTRISTFGRWPDREDLALDHAKMAEFAGAILAPDMRPLAGFASFAGEAVVYLMDPRTLQVLRQVTVTGECLAVLTDRLCDAGHEAGAEFAAILAKLRSPIEG